MRDIDLNLPLSSDSDTTEEGFDNSSVNDFMSQSMPIEQRIQFIQNLNTLTNKRPRSNQGSSPSGSAENNSSYYNKDGARLVAKALKKERLAVIRESKKAIKKGASYYDCNVCFKLAKEPVLTCCGHLFCWRCFYKIPYVDSFAKECPVCVGEVSDATVIPIYGNGCMKNGCNNALGNKTATKIPPRPKARRVEIVGPQRRANPPSNVAVVAL